MANATLAATTLSTTSATPATGIATLNKPITDNYVNFSISGTYGTVTFAFQGTFDGSTWFAVAGTLASDGSPATGTIAPSDNTTVGYSIPALGIVGVRLAVSAISTGAVVVTAQSNFYETLPAPASTTANFSSLGALTATSVTSSGLIKSTSATGGVGYATGAGAAGVQASSRTTTVVVTGMCGSITLVSAAGSATPFSFTVTNTSVAATDTIILSQKSGTDKYTTQVVTAVGAGSFQVTLANAVGTTTESPVFSFAVVRAVAA